MLKGFQDYATSHSALAHVIKYVVYFWTKHLKIPIEKKIYCRNNAEKTQGCINYQGKRLERCIALIILSVQLVLKIPFV